MLQRNWRAYAERASWGPTDKALVDRLRRGDTGAFDVLYDRHHPRLYGCLRRMIGDPERARDLVHDVFLRLIEKVKPSIHAAPSIDGCTRLLTICHAASCGTDRFAEERATPWNSNCAIRSVRPSPRPPDQGLDDERFRRALDGALAELDPERRSTFLLRHAQNLPLAEISEALGCPVGTVKSRLFHVTRTLATRLNSFDPRELDMPDRQPPSSDQTGQTPHG